MAVIDAFHARRQPSLEAIKGKSRLLAKIYEQNKQHCSWKTTFMMRGRAHYITLKSSEIILIDISWYLIISCHDFVSAIISKLALKFANARDDIYRSENRYFRASTKIAHFENRYQLSNRNLMPWFIMHLISSFMHIFMYKIWKWNARRAWRQIIVILLQLLVKWLMTLKLCFILDARIGSCRIATWYHASSIINYASASRYEDQPISGKIEADQFYFFVLLHIHVALPHTNAFISFPGDVARCPLASTIYSDMMPRRQDDGLADKVFQGRPIAWHRRISRHDDDYARAVAGKKPTYEIISAK